MTDLGAEIAAAEVLAGDPHRSRDAAGAHREDAAAHGLCANCETELAGAYCHACGQRAHLHNRLSDLLHEALESIAHFDGRLWRTLPVLALDPGRLSREWRAGRRVRYLQPLHLFLFATFLLFVIPTFTGQRLIQIPDASRIEAAVSERAEGGTREDAIVAAGVEDAAGHDHESLTGAERWGHMMGHKMRHVAENNQYYGYKIETLAYKLSFLVVPLSMAVLALLLAFRRGFTLYDHGVVALYGVGFLTLMLATASLLPQPVGGFIGQAALVVAPVHAIVHLKGAYGLGWPGAIIRGLLLSLLSAFVFILFIVGVFLLGVFA